MRFRSRIAAGLLVCLCLSGLSFASAYNAHPKLVVVIVVDQFRGDYLQRYSDQFGEGGFRLLTDHGAYFPDCYFDYANTSTAPGHATLLTGAYSNGHGILANEWWDPQKKKIVTSVEDEATSLVGVSGSAVGSSPHNLLADTLGDELKLATAGKARVFGISLKDRAAVLPAGFAANGAYWIEPKTGAWVTSTYYRSELPRWAADFNASQRAQKYLNQEWKDAKGKVLRTTRVESGQPGDFYKLVGSTPFANDYEFAFARELITYEKLGDGPATDLLLISLSANDILGHQVGPDSPEMEAMALALDRQLADFFGYLGHQVGLANIWIALSADHGVAPTASVAARLHIPTTILSPSKVMAELNHALSARLSPTHPAEYITRFGPSVAWLNEAAFSPLHMKEEDAERAVGEALDQLGMRGYYTRSQLARGEVPNTEAGLRFEHSYSPLGGWYVLAVLPPYAEGGETGAEHGASYSYDTHVPLAFYGIPFQPGTYRTHAEPVDLAVTLASLLGINAPTHAIGRVLTEALTPAHHGESSTHPDAGPFPFNSAHGIHASITPPALPAQARPATVAYAAAHQGKP
jgi:predicted AlkP superfamily pyrophosphatase or phosphodiesterase